MTIEEALELTKDVPGIHFALASNPLNPPNIASVTDCEFPDTHCTAPASHVDHANDLNLCSGHVDSIQRLYKAIVFERGRLFEIAEKLQSLQKDETIPSESETILPDNPPDGEVNDIVGLGLSAGFASPESEGGLTGVPVAFEKDEEKVNGSN